MARNRGGSLRRRTAPPTPCPPAPPPRTHPARAHLQVCGRARRRPAHVPAAARRGGSAGSSSRHQWQHQQRHSSGGRRPAHRAHVRPRPWLCGRHAGRLAARRRGGAAVLGPPRPVRQGAWRGGWAGQVPCLAPPTLHTAPPCTPGHPHTHAPPTCIPPIPPPPPQGAAIRVGGCWGHTSAGHPPPLGAHAAPGAGERAGVVCVWGGGGGPGGAGRGAPDAHTRVGGIGGGGCASPAIIPPPLNPA